MNLQKAFKAFLDSNFQTFESFKGLLLMLKVLGKSFASDARLVLGAFID